MLTRLQPRAPDFSVSQSVSQSVKVGGGKDRVNVNNRLARGGGEYRTYVRGR